MNDWKLQPCIAVLHEWAERFNVAFKLNVQTPAIQVEQLHCTTLGQYRNRRNGFGLKHEITLNNVWLSRPLPDVLATRFHESLHQWQETYCGASKRRYHNAQFRTKARQFGFIVDARGHHQRIEAGPFTALLQEHGVDPATLFDPKPAVIQIAAPGSKLKKWSCGCTNVRAAVAVEALWLKCHQLFQRAEVWR